MKNSELIRVMRFSEACGIRRFQAHVEPRTECGEKVTARGGRLNLALDRGKTAQGR